ncbi:MAG TPA: endolytic transglycosylase MltG [Candidatus Angelobacter sp.]|nr:endolytic transglycosylase MltG [Candidatus Angelobacter sp.]
MIRFLASLILIAAVILAGWGAYALFFPAGPTQQKFVQLKPGWSAHRIAAELASAGIVRSRYAFLLWHNMHGRKALKAGEYAFDHPARLSEIYSRIEHGDIYFQTVVIPEGFNMFDIAAAIEDAGLAKKEDFLQAAHKETALVRDLDPKAPSLEGYLFPDSYRFTRTQSAHDMAAAMVHRFRQAAHEVGLTEDIHDKVIMASIVEKETGVADERPEVAGVFYNRLSRNMALDTDPTVIYAALLNNRYRGTIYQSDLHFDSPYNTYRYSGLPPGAICNPGKASLQAALHPASNDYLYFVRDPKGNGRHNFSRTPAEHERNVHAYRRALAQAIPR